MKKNKKKIFAISFSLFLSFFLFTFSAHALDATYVPLASIPLPNASGNVGASGNLGSYFSEMYQLGVGIATALAVLMVIWGGVEYVTTDAIGGKEEGRQKVQNAILGLLLALGSYLILKTINPALLNTNLDIKSNNPQDSVGNYFPALPSGSDGAGSSGGGNNGPSGGGGWGGDGTSSSDPTNAWTNWTGADQTNLNSLYDKVAQYNDQYGTNYDPWSMTNEQLVTLTDGYGSVLTPEEVASLGLAQTDTNNQQAINSATPSAGGNANLKDIYNNVYNQWTPSDQTALDNNPSDQTELAKWQAIQDQLDALNTKYGTAAVSGSTDAATSGSGNVGPANQKVLDEINSGFTCHLDNCFTSAAALLKASGVQFNTDYQSSNYIVGGKTIGNIGAPEMPAPGDMVDMYTNAGHIGSNIPVVSDPYHSIVIYQDLGGGKYSAWDWNHGIAGLRTVTLNTTNPGTLGYIGRVYKPQ